MTESTTLGSDLRHERECRGLALRSISEKTKVSIALLEGLEADDISRWPGGIFRRAFVRSYAQCVGLDADDVIKRFELQFPPEGSESAESADTLALPGGPVVVRPFPQRPLPSASSIAARARWLGTAADLTVAAILAFGAAAAGSRLLWPVLLIAAYYAIGVIVTGTSPMVALLSDSLAAAAKPKAPDAPEAVVAAVVEPTPPRPSGRHAARLAGERPVRQRRGMQAPV